MSTAESCNQCGHPGMCEHMFSRPVVNLDLNWENYDPALDYGSDHMPLPKQLEKIGKAMSRHYGNHEILVPDSVFLNELDQDLLKSTKILNENWLVVRRKEIHLRHDYV